MSKKKPERGKGGRQIATFRDWHNSSDYIQLELFLMKQRTRINKLQMWATWCLAGVLLLLAIAIGTRW